MSPDPEADETTQNHALLVGEIAGILWPRLGAELETDKYGYTGRISIERPSGRWVLTVEQEVGP